MSESSGCVKRPALEPANQPLNSLIKRRQEKLTSEAEEAGGGGMRDTRRGRKKAGIDLVSGSS